MLASIPLIPNPIQFRDEELRTLLATVGHPKNHIRGASYRLGTSQDGAACT
jgi:hypothetical protein